MLVESNLERMETICLKRVFNSMLPHDPGGRTQ